MTKSNAAPEVDLNDEKLTDFGNSTPFLPYGEGKYTVQLLALLFHKGFKGRAYRLKVKIVTSDRKDVSVGYEYAVQFKLSDDKLKHEIAMKGLRSMCAAAYKADPADKKWDGNEALKTLLDLTTENMLEEADMKIEIVTREKQATDKDTKELKTNKDGSPKVFTNQFFNSIQEAA